MERATVVSYSRCVVSRRLLNVAGIVTWCSWRLQRTSFRSCGSRSWPKNVMPSWSVVLYLGTLFLTFQKTMHFLCLSLDASINISTSHFTSTPSATVNALYKLLTSLLTYCNLLQKWRTASCTGRAKKSNPLGKVRYLLSCSKFFRQIYRVYRGGFRPHILQISLELELSN